jgi:hypothetical protein
MYRYKISADCVCFCGDRGVRDINANSPAQGTNKIKPMIFQARTLEPVARGQTSVRVAGAFVCCARGVAGEHGARLPAGEAHQIALRAAAGQPIMRERVPELMRMKIGKADLGTSVLDHLVDAARRDSALLAEPAPRVGSVRMSRAGADIPVNVRAALVPMGRTISRRPLAMMRTTRERRSTSDEPASSALYRSPPMSSSRMPVSRNRRMIAMSRRSRKSLPAQQASNDRT